MMYLLYRTTNLINQKYYIGVTNGNNKWYKGSGIALQKAIKKYGVKNFTVDILETFATEKEAYLREAQVVTLDLVNDRKCYNMKPGGKGGGKQPKTEKHKQKISKSIKENYINGRVEHIGRKPIMDGKFLVEQVELYGFKEASTKLNLTRYQCRDRYYRAKNRVLK